MEYRLICTSCTDPVSSSLGIISCPHQACVTLEGLRQPEPEKVGIGIKQQTSAVLGKLKPGPTVRIDCTHPMWLRQLLYEILSVQGTIYTILVVLTKGIRAVSEGEGLLTSTMAAMEAEVGR